MVSSRGQKKLEPRPDRSPLGLSFKISDEQPHLFHMRSPNPGATSENEFTWMIINYFWSNLGGYKGQQSFPKQNPNPKNGAQKDAC